MASTVSQVAQAMAELRTALQTAGVPPSEIPIMVGAAGGVWLAMRS